MDYGAGGWASRLQRCLCCGRGASSAADSAASTAGTSTAADVSSDQMLERLDDVLDGRYTRDERKMLTARLQAADGASREALWVRSEDLEH